MEVVKAFVALKPGFEAGDDMELDIINFIRKRLSPLAMPQEIEFVDSLRRHAAARFSPRSASEGNRRADRRPINT